MEQCARKGHVLDAQQGLEVDITNMKQWVGKSVTVRGFCTALQGP